MNKDNNYTVYMHTCPNGKIYVGLTKQNPVDRWNNGRGYKNNEYFYRAIKKYGWQNIKHEILFTGLTKEEAEEQEIALISELKSNNRGYGYNIEEGGFRCKKIHIKDCTLPPFNEVLKNPAYLRLLTDLIKLCTPQKVVETITVENYIGETLIKKKTKEIEKVIDPNLSVVNELIDTYEEEPQLADLIKSLKRIRDKYGD